jgi:hypothetical protein
MQNFYELFCHEIYEEFDKAQQSYLGKHTFVAYTDFSYNHNVKKTATLFFSSSYLQT